MGKILSLIGGHAEAGYIKLFWGVVGALAISTAHIWGIFYFLPVEYLQLIDERSVASALFYFALTMAATLLVYRFSEFLFYSLGIFKNFLYCKFFGTRRNPKYILRHPVMTRYFRMANKAVLEDRSWKPTVFQCSAACITFAVLYLGVPRGSEWEGLNFSMVLLVMVGAALSDGLRKHENEGRIEFYLGPKGISFTIAAALFLSFLLGCSRHERLRNASPFLLETSRGSESGTLIVPNGFGYFVFSEGAYSFIAKSDILRLSLD